MLYKYITILGPSHSHHLCWALSLAPGDKTAAALMIISYAWGLDPSERSDQLDRTLFPVCFCCFARLEFHFLRPDLAGQEFHNLKSKVVTVVAINDSEGKVQTIRCSK
jgi:hypothetical protein